MDYKVSIVIPVYNAQNYLESCLESIINQTYKNLEIIIVNDGSIDNSLDICNKFEQRDPRIIVIDKKNSGVSKSRNEGIRRATGDFVTFVDSDDFLDPNAYSAMVEATKQFKTDITEINFATVDINGKTTSNDLKFEILDNTKDIVDSLIVTGLTAHPVWNKLYKKDLLDNICFRDYKFSEDFLFNVDISFKAKRKVTLSTIGYYYRQVESSAMNSEFKVEKMDRIRVREKIIEERCDKNFQYLEKSVSLELISYIIINAKEISQTSLKDYNKELSVLRECFDSQIQNKSWLTLLNRFEFKFFLMILLYKKCQHHFLKLFECKAQR